MVCLVLRPDQQLDGILPRDFHSKVDRAYILTDRSNEWTVMCQSLPLLTRWVNENLSTGEKWDTVSLTGVFQPCPSVFIPNRLNLGLSSAEGKAPNREEKQSNRKENPPIGKKKHPIGRKNLPIGGASS